MEIVEVMRRFIRAVLAHQHEVVRFCSSIVAAPDIHQFEKRMNGISDCYKALLLASPGR